MPEGTDSNSNSSPWWVNFIKQVGVPAAIALFLLWFVVFQQGARMDGIATQMAEAQRNMGNFVAEQRAKDGQVADLLRTMIEQQRVQIALGRRACLAEAKTSFDRNECLK